MKNDEQLQEEITRLLLEYDAGYTPPEIPKWLALIHEQRKEAVEEVKFDRAMFDAERDFHMAYVRQVKQHIAMIQSHIGPALEELDSLDYRTMKDKILLKSDILREYFRVMKGILPSVA
jgi:hypothetical protein